MPGSNNTAFILVNLAITWVCTNKIYTIYKPILVQTIFESLDIYTLLLNQNEKAVKSTPTSSEECYGYVMALFLAIWNLNN